MKMEIEEKIKNEIEKIKPFLNADGGNIEYIKFENGTVYVRFIGACAECSMIDYTLSDVVEEILINEIPEIKKVENVT